MKELPPPQPLARFLALYVALYAAYGVASPFLPALLQSRGLSAEQIGLAFAVGTAVKLITTPLAGWVADRWAVRSRFLSLFSILAGSAALLYLTAHGAPAILATHAVQAMALAPLSPFADALALVAREHPEDCGINTVHLPDERG